MPKTMKAPEVIYRLEHLGNVHGLTVKKQIRKQASNREIVKALELAKETGTRQIICDILGEQRAKTAVPVLISCLNDNSAGVRGSAADALGKIGNTKAGPALMKQFEIEENMGVKRMLAAVLGAVKYRPAIPLLITLLKENDTYLRGCAAWSLGGLQADEAIGPLEQALKSETESYPQECMTVALAALRKP
jgi:HEAT repeat protein